LKKLAQILLNLNFFDRLPRYPIYKFEKEVAGLEDRNFSANQNYFKGFNKLKYWMKKPAL